MDEKKMKFTSNQKAMLRRRGLDPKDYEPIKETYGALYIKNIHTGVTKVLNKNN